MNPKKCPKCGKWIKHATNYNRHVKHCGTNEFQCPDCKKSLSRQVTLKRHSKKAHPQRKTTKGFFCKECQKPFTYAAALKLHEESCGNLKPKPHHCSFPGCGKSSACKTNYQHHKKYAHQEGGSIKRKLEEEEDARKKIKKPKLHDTVKQVYKTDKEVSSLKGAKVDAFFYPKTETEPACIKALIRSSTISMAILSCSSSCSGCVLVIG